MTRPADILEPLDATASDADWAQERLRRQAMVLEALADAALRLAQSIEAEAAEARAEGRPIDTEAPMRFSRVARAVRMTALAQSRLLREFDEARARHARQASQAKQASAAEEAEAAAKADPAYAHKARVEAIVARVARAEHEDDDERVERLVAEACERLDDDDVYGDVAQRPIGELVSLLCRDLGLEPDWTRLAEEAWAKNDPYVAGLNSSAASPACGGGGPSAERSEKPMVERAGLIHDPPAWFSAPPTL